MTGRAATRRPSRIRSLLAGAASATLLGIAFSVAGDSSVGTWLTLGGLVFLVYGLHRFCRSGPDG